MDHYSTSAPGESPTSGAPKPNGSKSSKHMTHSHQKQTITPYPDQKAILLIQKVDPRKCFWLNASNERKVFIINKNLCSAMVSDWDEDEWSSDGLQFLLLITMMNLDLKREYQHIYVNLGFNNKTTKSYSTLMLHRQLTFSRCPIPLYCIAYMMCF